ncbi:MAG: hypothetical protein ACXWR1_19550 [Bdellovibrionota bacterium]
MIWIILLAVAPMASAQERPKYCEEPAFIIRGEPENHADSPDEEVLTPEERADPALARQLAATPGPYGHSELGFRYLSRMFGYRGGFSERQKVEDWIVHQEAEKHAFKKGLWEVWDHWVVNPSKRLGVPRGRLGRLPADGSPDMFFLDARDRYEYARCVKVELATRLCQNYNGRGREFQEKDVVLFSRSTRGGENYGYCQVRIPPWRRKLERHLEDEFLHGARIGSPAGFATPAEDSESENGHKTAK